MPADADRAHIERLLEAPGRRVRNPHTVHLVDGTSAVLVGWRDSTRDIDVRPEPDSDQLLEALSELKDQLDVNIELASPLDYLPDLPGWPDRSPYQGRYGQIDVRTSTSACRRWRSSSGASIRTWSTSEPRSTRGLASADELESGWRQMQDRLFRFPSVNAEGVGRRLRDVLG